MASTHTHKGIKSSAISGTLIGAGIGAVAGALFAYFENKEYVIDIIIGAVAAGLISRAFLVKK